MMRYNVPYKEGLPPMLWYIFKHVLSALNLSDTTSKYFYMHVGCGCQPSKIYYAFITMDVIKHSTRESPKTNAYQNGLFVLRYVLAYSQQGPQCHLKQLKRCACMVTASRIALSMEAPTRHLQCCSAVVIKQMIQ